MTPYESGLVCAHAFIHSSIHLENYRILARKLILSQPPNPSVKTHTDHLPWGQAALGSVWERLTRFHRREVCTEAENSL